MSGGLDEPINEGGSNLSHGQRQLLCIARALLKKTRILVVDEGMKCTANFLSSFTLMCNTNPVPLTDCYPLLQGTSAVDPTTDEMIQKALRASSATYGTTILAIAHRLQTIRDFDMIMVMSEGKIVEYDVPQNLLDNANSMCSYPALLSLNHI